MVATVLAQDLIRRDIEIVDLRLKKTFDSNYLKKLTNRLKYQIYQYFDGKPEGKIIFLSTNKFHIVVPALIAIWELGAAIFCNDVDPKVQKLPYFKKFFDVVDLVITDFYNNDIWIDSNKILTIDYLNLDDQKEFNTKFSVSNKDIAYYTTSSGTTSDPKLLSFTHQQTVMMSEYIRKLLVSDYQTVVPFHFKTLHHGSLFNSFALPMLSSTQIHYTAQYTDFGSKFIEKICKDFVNNKITHFLSPYNWIREFAKVPDCDLENLTLCTIQGNTDQEMQDLLTRFKPKQVINYFGCSEVGTVFVGVTNKNNVNEYNPNRFDTLIEYLDLEVHQNFIKVKWKHSDQWHIIADKIDVIDKKYWFRGRDLTFTVGDKQLDLKVFADALKEYLRTEQLIVVPDYSNQLLYLATFDIELQDDDFCKLNDSLMTKFGKEFLLSKHHKFDANELLFGMKISGPLLLFLFRTES